MTERIDSTNKIFVTFSLFLFILNDNCIRIILLFTSKLRFSLFSWKATEIMDHKSWLWRRRSSEKTIVAAEKVAKSLRKTEVEVTEFLFIIKLVFYMHLCFICPPFSLGRCYMVKLWSWICLLYFLCFFPSPLWELSLHLRVSTLCWEKCYV